MPGWLAGWAMAAAAALQPAALGALLSARLLPSLPWSRRIACAVAAAATAGLAGDMLLAALALGGGDDAPFGSTLWLSLAATHAGLLRVGALAALLVLWLDCVRQADGRPGWPGCLAALAMLLARAAGGHVADALDPVAALTVHGLHLAAIALWSGSVLAAAMAGWRASAAPALLARRLSALATATLPVIALTGALNWQRMQPMVGLWRWHGYPLWLTVKLASALAALALGAWNRWRHLPDDDAAPMRDAAAFWRILRLEALLLALTLLLGARLGAGAPGE